MKRLYFCSWSCMFSESFPKFTNMIHDISMTKQQLFSVPKMPDHFCIPHFVSHYHWCNFINQFILCVRSPVCFLRSVCFREYLLLWNTTTDEIIRSSHDILNMALLLEHLTWRLFDFIRISLALSPDLHIYSNDHLLALLWGRMVCNDCWQR